MSDDDDFETGRDALGRFKTVVRAAHPAVGINLRKILGLKSCRLRCRIYGRGQ